MLLSCPSCQIPLAELDARTGYVDTTCAKCRFGYRFVFGTLEKRSSRQITLQRQTSKRSGSYQREYEFRLRLGSGELQVITLAVSGRDDWILVRRGDLVSIAYSLRGTHVEDTLVVTDHTTGERYELARAGAASRRKSLQFAVLFGLFVFLMLWIAFRNTFFASAAVALGFAIVLYVVAVIVTSPRRKLDLVSSALITEHQDLLAQKRQVLLARSQANDDMVRKVAARDKLLLLQRKMLSVGSDVYKEQLQRLDAAVRLIDEQLSVGDQLLLEYDRLAAMIEIEVETRGASGSSLAAASDAIATTRQEVSRVRQRFDELEATLLTNQELATLLQ